MRKMSHSTASNANLASKTMVPRILICRQTSVATNRQFTNVCDVADTTSKDMQAAVYVRHEISMAIAQLVVSTLRM